MANNKKNSRPKPASSPKPVREDLEIEAGIYPMPQTEQDGEAPVRREIFVWKRVPGTILGSEIADQGELIARAGRLLRESFNAMNFLPGTLRVASEELAVLLRPAITPRIKLVCGPTEELDHVVEDMYRQMGPPSYCKGGAQPSQVASFFRAAAQLYQAKPWKAISADDVIGLTIEDFSIHNEIVVVVAPKESASPGLLLAISLAELDEYLETVGSPTDEVSDSAPIVVQLVFESPDRLPASMLDEIRRHRWQLADPGACPVLEIRGPEGIAAEPSEEDFANFEAISLGLVELMKDHRAVKKALSGKGPPVVCRTRQNVDGQMVEVVLTAPYLEGALAERPQHPLLGQLYDLESAEAIDSKRRVQLEQALFAELGKVAGNKAATFEWLPMVLEIAAEHLEVTAVSLDAETLDTVLFEIFPRSVAVGPEDAKTVIAECQVFFQFLVDSCDHDYVASCLPMLESKDFLKHLGDAFRDRSRFGVGKQLLAAGADAGHDMTTKEGIEGWLQAVSEKGLPPGIQLPFPFVPANENEPAPGKGPKGRKK